MIFYRRFDYYIDNKYVIHMWGLWGIATFCMRINFRFYVSYMYIEDAKNIYFEIISR